jgi:hypothetical protein
LDSDCRKDHQQGYPEVPAGFLRAVVEGKEPAETTTRTGSVHILRNDPKMREAFINKVAVPVANKMNAA